MVAGLPDGVGDCGCADWLDDVTLPVRAARAPLVRVLLTGAAGFIGSAIDEQLTARGDEVVRVDALIPQAHSG